MTSGGVDGSRTAQRSDLGWIEAPGPTDASPGDLAAQGLAQNGLQIPAKVRRDIASSPEGFVRVPLLGAREPWTGIDSCGQVRPPRPQQSPLRNPIRWGGHRLPEIEEEVGALPRRGTFAESCHSL